MSLLRVNRCVICKHELSPSVGNIVHPICAAREQQGLPIMLSVFGCICCSSSQVTMVMDTKGGEFAICARCRPGTRHK